MHTPGISHHANLDKVELEICSPRTVQPQQQQQQQQQLKKNKNKKQKQKRSHDKVKISRLIMCEALDG